MIKNAHKHSAIFFTVAVIFCLFGQQALGATYEAAYKPWSGYWWPMTEGGVVTGKGYNQSPSPLEKYDYVTSGTYNGPATAYGLRNYYKPNGLEWEGLCYNWAAAAILEEEPAHKGVFQGTIFNVGDKKALLTVAYHGALCNEYSVNTPETFHQTLEQFIREQKTPIMMDLGANGEIWFYPVFKYETNYTEIGNIRHYTTKLYYAHNAVSPDYVGTFETDATYYYSFTLDPLGNITDSAWEGSSIAEPPVKALEPYGTEPANPGIDYDQVLQIAQATDDIYKGNNSTENAALLYTGGYRLLALENDFFKIPLEAGDRLDIQAVNGDDAVRLKLYDPQGEMVKETGKPESFSVEAEAQGDYILEIIPSSYVYEPEYELYLQLKLACQKVFPINPSGLWVNGLALLRSEGETGRTLITVVDEEGLPQRSYTDQSPAPHLLGTLEDTFSLTADDGYIRVDSDMPLKGLQAAISGEDLMMGGDDLPGDTAAAEIFFPHFAKTDGWRTYYGLINIGEHTEQVVRQAYGSGGELLSSDVIELAPGQKVENDTLYMKILNNGALSMSVSAESGREVLLGYITFLNPSFSSKGRALIPLSFQANPDLVIPHIACDQYWSTGIAVMNTGDIDSSATFSAYDTAGNLVATAGHLLAVRQNLVLDVRALFPGYPGEQIASVRITSGNDQPLSGFVLYESSDRLQLAGIPIGPPSDMPLYLPHLACTGGWWTGIGVTNAGTLVSETRIALFNANGEIVTERFRSLNPGQRLCHTVYELFDGNLENLSAAKYLKVTSESGQPLSGIYLMGANGSQMMGGNIR